MPISIVPRARSAPAATNGQLLDQFQAVRAQTRALTDPFSPEDLNLQPLVETSPGKWHLAHTSWFFDTFLLQPFSPHYVPFDAQFRDLFNSYYDSIGPQVARDQRAKSRPSLPEVLAYRAFVDEGVAKLWPALGAEQRRAAAPILLQGLNHEQQHQELLLTDLKYALSLAPRSSATAQRILRRATSPLTFIPQPEGLCTLGVDVLVGEGLPFAFDNEGPRHRVFLEPHALGSRLVTNAEFLAFMEDGGYTRPEFWLSEGFALARREGWTAPLYWTRREQTWAHLTHNGSETPLNPDDPVAHVSYYEAEAYAHWANARLPTEAEWEHAAAGLAVEGNFLESGAFAPRPAGPVDGSLQQLFGDLWEWTQSAYLPYPRYRPAAGALGEYNGKFMINQMVLRGGSAFSPRSHLRATYRNFFPPNARWQLSGIRLARDLD